jgi:RNA polymerase sigma-70 factor (ECF subfamily)
MKIMAVELNKPMVYGLLPHPPIVTLPIERVTDTDYLLACAAATGTADAIGDLYRRHSRRVYSLCLRITRDAADAEDLTQEVFIQLLRKIGSFRGESHFTTWLYRLTVNQALMYLRRRNRRREQLVDARDLIQITGRKSGNGISHQVADKIALDAAVNRLSPGCRAIFLLFSVEGYNHEEIASLYGCSVGNSKSQLHKARKKLRRLLPGYFVVGPSSSLGVR